MEGETNPGVDEVMKENAAEQSYETVEGTEVLSRALEDEPTLDSVVKPVVDELTQVEAGFENLALVSDPWTSLRNSEPVQESSDAVKSAPTEQENADLDEHSRAVHTQPFVAVTAGTRASWTNCCGLLDVLRPSDQ
ncbi:hypothetical protein ACS0TY_018493 [Phlomoides rotata]